MSRFTSSQSVDLALPGSLAGLQAYLAQPSRLVYALFDSKRVQELGDDVFRLQMRSLQFFMLKVQPTVDLRVWTDADSVLHIEALDCQLAGIDAIRQQFTLTLTGHLQPAVMDPKALQTDGRLVGRADLAVQVELPPTFAIASNAIIGKAGNRLLNSVLKTIKQRLMDRLSKDYCQWSATQASEITIH
ncbi:MAG: DUF1997 domain-containing protein [Elainellaceae cyanobacterium]